MLSHNTWKQKRELFLRLGTKEYPKPAQLPVCVPVLDFAENKLKNAENFVEPVGYDDIFIYSDTLLSVCGIPIPKKGFSSDFKNDSESRTIRYLKTV